MSYRGGWRSLQWGGLSTKRSEAGEEEKVGEVGGASELLKEEMGSFGKVWRLRVHEESKEGGGFGSNWTLG